MSNVDTTPFDENKILLRYPGKTEVVNQIDGTKYTVDEFGNKVGPTVPFVPISVGVGPDSKESRQPTQAEEDRFGWWMIPAGLSLLSVIAAIVLFTHLRGRKDS